MSQWTALWSNGQWHVYRDGRLDRSFGADGEQEARTYAAIKICKARLAYIKIMELARKELPPEAFED